MTVHVAIYPKRLFSKIKRMYEIGKVLPATFTVIQKRTGFSSRTVANLLKEMLGMELIKKFYNVYELIPYSPKEGEYFNPNLTEEEKFTIILLKRIKTKITIKMPGKRCDPRKVKPSGLEEILRSIS